MLFERFYSTADDGDMLLRAVDAAELSSKNDPSLTNEVITNLFNRLNFVAKANHVLSKQRVLVNPQSIVAMRVAQAGNRLVTSLGTKSLRAGRYFGGFVLPRDGIPTESLVAHMPVDITFLTADCATITGYGKRYAFAIHGSWPNLIKKDIIGQVVARVERLGENLADLSVEVGPTIGQDHYEVDPPVTRPLRKRFPEIAEKVLAPSPRGGKHELLDIPYFVQLIFEQLGVGRIRRTNLDTWEHGYFSYRKDKTNKRFMTMFVARNEV